MGSDQGVIGWDFCIITSIKSNMSSLMTEFQLFNSSGSALCGGSCHKKPPHGWPLVFCPAAGLGERVPQTVQGRGGGGAGAAGPAAGPGVADQRDAADRLSLLHSRTSSDNHFCLTFSFFL